MQLWAHYTTLMDGERMYNINILRICHTSTQPCLQEGVEDVFSAVYGVLRWPFLNNWTDSSSDWTWYGKLDSGGTKISI